jgi:hypothetical protein
VNVTPWTLISSPGWRFFQAFQKSEAVKTSMVRAGVKAGVGKAVSLSQVRVVVVVVGGGGVVVVVEVVVVVVVVVVLHPFGRQWGPAAGDRSRSAGRGHALCRPRWDFERK